MPRRAGIRQRGRSSYWDDEPGQVSIRSSNAASRSGFLNARPYHALALPPLDGKKHVTSTCSGWL
jgi:hypothetical protein